jgi:hypothetical protein
MALNPVLLVRVNPLQRTGGHSEHQEVSQAQRAKVLMFSLSYVEYDPMQTQQYLENQITLTGGHIREREGKSRKVR